MDVRLIGRWQCYQYQDKKKRNPVTEPPSKGDLLKINPDWSAITAIYDEALKALGQNPWDVETTEWLVFEEKGHTVIGTKSSKIYIVQSITGQDLKLITCNRWLEPGDRTLWYKRLPDKE